MKWKDGAQLLCSGLNDNPHLSFVCLLFLRFLALFIITYNSFFFGWKISTFALFAFYVILIAKNATFSFFLYFVLLRFCWQDKYFYQYSFNTVWKNGNGSLQEFAMKWLYYHIKPIVYVHECTFSVSFFTVFIFGHCLDLLNAFDNFSCKKSHSTISFIFEYAETFSAQRGYGGVGRKGEPLG